MQKKDDQTKLRTVDEIPEGEVLPLDGQPMGGNEEKVRLEVKDRSELKFRTHEPKLEERLDQEDSFEDEWNTGKETMRGHKGIWMSIGLILILGVGWLGFEISQLEQPVVTTPVDTYTLVESDDQAELDARQTIATIREVVMNFYGSGTVDEMVKYVRHAERVGPLMKDYYAQQPLRLSEVVSIENLNPLTIGNRGGFWVVLTKHESGADGKLVVEVNSPSDAKADWETYICHQPMDWDKFVKERPVGYRGDFRVYVERDDFYNYEFADSNKYQAFRITTLNSSEVIFGYALRDGQVFRELDGLLTRNKNQKVPAMLRLHLQEGLQSKSGVVIDKVVAPRWLLVDSPEVSE